ncbi:MAG: KOW domain-containing RNA-binding protein [Clostridiales bacterium]|nr:KOW domain-containing RNA-binding protein [Clostridiales bacterium]
MSEITVSCDLTNDYIGNVCVSLAGHDAGLVMVVVGVCGEYLLLANGKTRKISAPKKKKAKHVSTISRLDDKTRDAIICGSANDSLLRREISRVICQKLN